MSEVCHDSRRRGLHGWRMRILQEVDAAGARWRSNPHEAEDGGGLVTDVGGNHAADKLGPAKLSLWHHTWKSQERRRCQLSSHSCIHTFLWSSSVRMLVHLRGILTVPSVRIHTTTNNLSVLMDTICFGWPIFNFVKGIHPNMQLKKSLKGCD